MSKRMKEVERLAAIAGMHVSTYRPGDGITRYRFSIRPGDYFEVDKEYTALGIKDALSFARGAAAAATMQENN